MTLSVEKQEIRFTESIYSAFILLNVIVSSSLSVINILCLSSPITTSFTFVPSWLEQQGLDVSGHRTASGCMIHVTFCSIRNKDCTVIVNSNCFHSVQDDESMKVLSIDMESGLLLPRVAATRTVAYGNPCFPSVSMLASQCMRCGVVSVMSMYQPGNS